jgi:hypothetical protein
MSSLLSVCRAQNLLEEDSLEAVPEEDQPQTRSPPAHRPEEAVALIAVAADRKKSSSAGGEGRKKSSKGGDSAPTGKRRKSSLFLRLKNFKSLPSISLPRIFNLSKLLKKEKSQPIMTLAVGGGGGAAAVSSLLLAAGVSPKSVELSAAKAEFWLGEGRVDAVAVAGGWKRRRKGRIRTVLVVKEVREIKYM